LAEIANMLEHLPLVEFVCLHNGTSYSVLNA